MFEVESAPRAAPGAPEQAAEIPTEPGAAGVGRDFAVTALGQLGVAVGGLVLYRLLARDQGASALGSYALVKQVTLFLFPATMLGPQFIKDVRAPLPQVKLVPTGGVTPNNAGDWIRAGAVAVGTGSALVDAASVEHGRFEMITANARRAVANVAAARLVR